VNVPLPRTSRRCWQAWAKRQRGGKEIWIRLPRGHTTPSAH